MADLTLLNPWWKGKEYLYEDKHLKEFEEKKYKWYPRVKAELIPNNVFTLRGPRQVGKTTLIKLWIKSLMDKNISEKSIFFWNCDELVDFRELAALLRQYLELAKVYHCTRKYIFLDEVSRIRDWQRAIKSMVDSGELEECCIVVTGSHTLDLKYGLERLPGRTGKQGKDLFLLPLSFAEYVQVIKPEIAAKITPVQQISIAEINHSLLSAQPYNAELKVLFSQYLITGGFLVVANTFFSEQKIADYLYELYARWIIGDLVKWRKQEKIAIQLLRAIIEKQSTALSWGSLAKESEIKSNKTVSAYVEDLENMFALVVAYFLDLHTLSPNFDKNKKIYFIDPFIYHVFNKKIFFKENEIVPSLIEGTVIANLARIQQGKTYPNIYYWKNKREVDVLILQEKRVFPLEVKYQATISTEDYQGLYHFASGVLITKDTLKIGEKYSAIPAHLLLAVLPVKGEQD